MTNPAQEIAALGEQRKKRGPYKKRPLTPFEEDVLGGSASRQGQHPKKSAKARAKEQAKAAKAHSSADPVDPGLPDSGTSVPDLGTKVLGTVDRPDPKASPRQRVASSPRRAQDLSGAIGKDLHSFTDVSWKEFLTLIANGARKPDLLHKMGVTNASFNTWLSTTAGAAAEYENARLQWLRRDWPLELIEDICVDFIMDKPLSKICTERGLDEPAFWRVIMREPTYQEMFDEARHIHMERQAEQLLRISDEIELDGVNTTANSAKVNQARLRTENRRWLMERLHPERFGKVTKHDIDMQTTVNHAEELDKARKRNEKSAALRNKLLTEAENPTIH